MRFYSIKHYRMNPVENSTELVLIKQVTLTASSRMHAVTKARKLLTPPSYDVLTASETHTVVTNTVSVTV